MNWKSKRVLVTGAGGFIGSHLVEELVKIGTKVKAFVHYNSRNDWGNIDLLPQEIRKELQIVAGDVRDPFFVGKAVKKCDIVFHLAALIAIPYSYITPNDFVDTNVTGTLNLLHHSLEQGIEKFIHTSTSEVYGTAKYLPIDEKHPLQPQSPYSASKIAADMLAQSYYLSFGLPVAIIRPFNTFGPRQSARAVIPTIVTQILSDSKTIRMGMLEPIRDFTYVKDTISAFIKICESKNSVGQIINIGTGTGTKIGDLVKTIMKLTKRTVKVNTDRIRIRPQKSEVMALICCNKKAKKILNWQPSYSLTEGLIETITYIQQHMQNYKPNIYNV